MAGLSLHKGSHAEPTAWVPRDHIKLDLVLIFPETKVGKQSR